MRATSRQVFLFQILTTHQFRHNVRPQSDSEALVVQEDPAVLAVLQESTVLDRETELHSEHGQQVEHPPCPFPQFRKPIQCLSSFQLDSLCELHFKGGKEHLSTRRQVCRAPERLPPSPDRHPVHDNEDRRVVRALGEWRTPRIHLQGRGLRRSTHCQ